MQNRPQLALLEHIAAENHHEDDNNANDLEHPVTRLFTCFALQGLSRLTRIARIMARNA